MRQALTYTIGTWQFDPGAGILRGPGATRPLEDRAARVLDVLCRRRGDIVSKGDLLREVWQGRSVSPNSVAIVIGDLRSALGDSSSEPMYIFTVGKRGYRLAAPAGERARGQRRWMALVSSVTACVALAMVAAMTWRHDAARVELAVMPTRNETGQARFDALARSLSTVMTDGAVTLQDGRVIAIDGAGTAGPGQVILRSRLIIWNGRPELAIAATDASTRRVLWSTFATDRSGNLARDAAVRLKSLDARLDRIRREPSRGVF